MYIYMCICISHMTYSLEIWLPTAILRGRSNFDHLHSNQNFIELQVQNELPRVHMIQGPISSDMVTHSMAAEQIRFRSNLFKHEFHRIAWL